MGWDVVGAVGSATTWVHDKTEEAADEAGHAIDSAVHSAEHAVDDARKAMVDFGARHGGFVGKTLAQNVSNSIGIAEGATLAVYDAASGVATLARGLDHLASPVEWAMHPERNLARAETAGNALAAMAKLGSPVEWLLQPQANAATAKALWNGVTAGYQDAAKSGDWSKFAGRAVVDVGSFFIGAGEANAALKGAEGARGAVQAAEGLNAAAAQVHSAPAWFQQLAWSEPVSVEALRANRASIPSEPGVYVFTKYAGPLERNTGVLYVGKANRLDTRLPSYLADPRKILVLSQKSGGTRVSSTLHHPGKSLLLMEMRQHYRAGNVDSGIFVRWVRQSEPKSLEDPLIRYLQPAFNTQGR